MVKMNFWGPPGTSYIRNLTFLLSGPDVKHICSWAVSAIVRGAVTGLVAAGLLSPVPSFLWGPQQGRATAVPTPAFHCLLLYGVLRRSGLPVSPALSGGFFWSCSRGRTWMALSYFLAERRHLALVLGMDAWFGFILLWRSSFNLRKLVVSDYITLVFFFLNYLWPWQMASNCF